MVARPDTIDIHAHIIVPAAAELVRASFDPARDPFLRYGGASTRHNETLFADLRPKFLDPAVRLAEMDRQGVHRQAISIAPAHYHYWADPELGAEVARIQNDGIAEAVARHPDRFLGMGTLPMQAPERAEAELQRIVTELHFRGVSINPSAEGRDYDDPAYERFWTLVEEHDLVVVLHPNGFRDGARLTEYYMINVVGNPMETTVALSRLVMGGVIERHPRARIVAVHGGGYLPFYMDRMDHAYECRPEIAERISRPPSSYLKQLSFDSVVFGTGLADLVRLVGADHVLLGTDYPFDMGDSEPVRRIEALERDGVSEADRQLMLGGNAARLLGLS